MIGKQVLAFGESEKIGIHIYREFRSVGRDSYSGGPILVGPDYIGSDHMYADDAYQDSRSSSFGSVEEDFFLGFYHIWAWLPSWSCDQDHLSKLSFPHPIEAPYEI